MTENSNNTLLGQSPTRYGLTSLIAACLAFASWPLTVVVGFVMVYVAFLLALTAVISGLLGVGTGIYYKEWMGTLTGAAGAGLAGLGVWAIFWAMTHF